MKQAKRLTIVFLTIVFSIICANAAFGGDVKVKFLEKAGISPDNESLRKPLDFCVTEDELFLIPDYEAGNIKIYERYEKSLESVEIIGREMCGTDELLKPAYFFYKKDEGKFGVIDYRLRKIFIYDRIGRIEFERVKAFSCLSGTL